MKLKKALFASGTLLACVSQAATLPISGGYENGIALCKDGNVYAWGNNEYYKKVSADTSKGIAAHVDTFNTLALDSSVEGFEHKSYYTKPSLVNTNGIKFVDVETNVGYFFLGLSDKGILYHWGIELTDQVRYVSEPEPVLKGETLGFSQDGNFGGDYLGDVKKAISYGNGYAALLNDGRFVISSENFRENHFAVDVDGNPLKDIVDISAGDFCIYGLCANGLMYGSGSFDGKDEDNGTFSPVINAETSNPLKDVANISAGSLVTFAVTKDGQAYGFGNGGWGGCTGTGKMDLTTEASPILSGDYYAISKKDYLSNVKQIGGGRGYGVAVTLDGYALYWGNNEGNGGVAGLDTADSRLFTPTFLRYEDGSIVDDAVAVECGSNFGYVVNKKNEYFAFGLNTIGQCGVGSDSEKIHYLHPMSFDCELAALCPTVRLLNDTITAYTNGSYAIESLVLSESKDKDYTLNWYLNDKELEEMSNICSIEEEGEYKVVMTPTDDLCATTSDYTFVKMATSNIINDDITFIIDDTVDVKNLILPFGITSKVDATVILYSDKECTNVIDTMNIKAGENEVKISASLVSVEDKNANVWLKEIKKTTLLTQDKFEDEQNDGNFQTNGMLFKSANNAKLHSYNFQFASFMNSTEVIVTPMLYRAKLNEYGKYQNFELVNTGLMQNFIAESRATECTVICDFDISNDGIYVLGMSLNGNGKITTSPTPKSKANELLFIEPISDVNNCDIKWVGSSANSYSLANTAVNNCYYNLVFNNIESASCGAIKLTTFIETTITDCINITNADVKPEGDKYDIFGRKVVNVQPKNIYIQNGKKFIFRK